MTTAFRPGQILAVGAAHEDHGAGGRAGDETAFEIAGRKLAGIDDMQAVDVLFGQDGLDDRLASSDGFGKRQLHENAVQAVVGVKGGDERCELFLRRFLRQGCAGPS